MSPYKIHLLTMARILAIINGTDMTLTDMASTDMTSTHIAALPQISRNVEFLANSKLYSLFR